MLQEDDVLPSQRGRRLKGEGKGIERNARGAPRVSLAPKTPFPKTPFQTPATQARPGQTKTHYISVHYNNHI